MKTIKQVLLGKNPNIWSISPEASVFQALEMLADKDIGALIVLENNEIVGILFFSTTSFVSSMRF